MAASHASRQTGSKLNTNTVSWREFFEGYEPTSATLLVCDGDGKPRRMVQTRRTPYDQDAFMRAGASEESYCGMIKAKTTVMVLALEPHSEAGESALLQNIAPPWTGREFTEGNIGKMCAAWLRTIFFEIVSVDRGDAEREQRIEWFSQVAVFTASIARRHSDWFLTMFNACQTTKPEDVLECTLLAAVLGTAEVGRWTRPGKDRLLPWFMLSMHRNFRNRVNKSITRLKYDISTSMAGIFAMVFAFFLNDGLTVAEAIARTHTGIVAAYEMVSMADGSASLMGVTVNTAEAAPALQKDHPKTAMIVKALLALLFPPLAPHSAAVLETCLNGNGVLTELEELLTEPVNIDGDFTLVPPQPLPRGIDGASVTLHGAGDNEFVATPRDLKEFMVVRIDLAGHGGDEEMTVEVFGAPVAGAGGNGARLLARLHPSGTAINAGGWSGVHGVSLSGGQGNGRQAPTKEYPEPRDLTEGTAGQVKLCDITVKREGRWTSLQIQHPTWRGAVKCNTSSVVPAVDIYCKSINSLRFVYNRVVAGAAAGAGAGADAPPPYEAVPVARPSGQSLADMLQKAL